MDTNAKPIYPVEPWGVTEDGFQPEHNYRNETTFALSNGYIGTRGTFEESYDFDVMHGLEGNFINGFYESEPIRYGECCFGFPEVSQTMLNVPNAKTLRLFLDDEAFDMREGKLRGYRRTLHMDRATVTRELTWTSSNGKQIKLRTERLVSFADKHLMALRFEVTPLNFSGVLRFVSELNANVENHTRTTNPLVDYGPYGHVLLPEELRADERGLFVKSRTKNTKLALACLCAQNISQDCTPVYAKDESHAYAEYTTHAKQGEPVSIETYVAYTTSLDEGESAFEETLQASVQNAIVLGFATLVKRQKAYMGAFWSVSDVRVKGDDALQQGLRFNLFHLMQGAGRDGNTGLGAKGLSGEGYEGHSFWDTEMYALPVFTHTFPELTKRLLDYRYNALDEARARARILGHPKGALFPWRTINGKEASSYYPLGTAQYHIDADIAYAFQQYISVTGDIDFLAEKGAEVLCETARIWADVGGFAESRDGKYCICCVTGPDEYNALVDNNFYTNLMARENLRDALNALELLKRERPQAYEELVQKIGLEENEPALWRKIADNMYFPYDEKLGVYPQDDGFLQRKPWDDSKIAPEKRHLLFENFHPLFVFRQRMSKQADAILGLYLHDDLFRKDELKRNFDFYQTVTLHHSSLSTCIFGLLACEIGYTDLAYEYFSQSARMDLDDYHENFYAGIHAANMAGTWLSVANGFGGMRTNGGKLRFTPFLPEKWQGYAFRVEYRGAVLDIEVTPGDVVYTLMNESPIAFWHGEKKIRLTKQGEQRHETL